MAHVTNLEPEVAEELPAGSRRHWAARVSRAFARLVEIPAALLVVAQIIVLLAGILARYVFHAPIVWSDELAGMLFLWLAMLGSVIAFQRGEHMRMTAIVGILGPRARAFLDVVAAVPIAFAFIRGVEIRPRRAAPARVHPVAGRREARRAALARAAWTRPRAG